MNDANSFAAPPPLSRQKSAATCSYTSLKALVSESESLLPPPIEDIQDAQNEPVLTEDPSLMQPDSTCFAAGSVQGRALSNLCDALSSGDGVVITSPETPSLTRSTMYTDRKLSADDIVNAIESIWEATQLPSIIIDDEA